MSIADEIDQETNALIKDCDQHLKHCKLQNVPLELAKEVWQMRQMGALIVMLKRLDHKLTDLIEKTQEVKP